MVFAGNVWSLKRLARTREVICDLLFMEELFMIVCSKCGSIEICNANRTEDDDAYLCDECGHIFYLRKIPNMIFNVSISILIN